MSEVLLNVENLEAFYGPVMAIRGVSLEVRRGEIVTVLGANGAGKTTLMKTVSGVMVPEKGTIRFEGEPIAGLEPDALVRRGIVHVPEGREVFPLLTVAENLSMGAYLRSDRVAVQRDRELAFHYFPILKERLGQTAGTLSGGQQQMLALARGLMGSPKLMLLDEPSLGLSPLLVQEIFAIVKRLNAEQGLTILLVEQDARVALEVAHSAYVMELGRIVMAGSAAALAASKDVQTFYLGMGAEASPRGERRWKTRKTWR